MTIVEEEKILGSENSPTSFNFVKASQPTPQPPPLYNRYPLIGRMADNDSYIHLARPLLVISVPPAPATTTSPLSVVINADAPFSILDHSLRRNVDRERVIGTVLSVREEDGVEVEIGNCFAVGYNESQEQVGLRKIAILWKLH